MKKTIAYLVVVCKFIMALSIFTIIWVKGQFGEISFEQLLFHLKVPMDGVNTEFVAGYIFRCIFPTVIVVILLMIIKKFWNKRILLFKSQLNNVKKRNVKVGNVLDILLMIGFIMALNSANQYFEITKYIKNLTDKTLLYEEYYVHPSSTTLVFPEEKRNLIYIFMESMETTYLSKELGGTVEKNLLPGLTNIAKENISFSTSDKFQGSYSAPNTTWTVGAMVSHTSGVPLRLPIEGNSYSGYQNFLPGVWTIGDILNEQGYNQMLMVGSDANFAGRKDYFIGHGNYDIWDYYTAIEKQKIESDYYVFWGYEDQKLYEYAKEEITKLAKQEEPFNFTMLTVDTHHVSGYYCELCGDEHDSQYSNVIACADQQISEFIQWIQQQSFYENTTVIITGDHNSMDPNWFDHVSDEYRRATYNAIINAPISTENIKNRAFTSFDMYPTTLASLGVEIEGDQLGLGVNLFSSKPTLSELLGVDYFFEELEKLSLFYNKQLLYKK